MNLKQVVSIESGYPFRGKIPEVENSQWVVVQMKDISLTTGINWESCVTTELTGKREPSCLQSGDILFAARGSHNYAVQVDSAILKNGVRVVASPHFYVLSIKNSLVESDYLVWFLNQMPAQRYFEQNAEGSVTKSIRRVVLENTPIAIPTIEEQRSIIALAKVVEQERSIAERLVQNGKDLMNVIANGLLKGKEGVGYE